MLGRKACWLESEMCSAGSRMVLSQRHALNEGSTVSRLQHSIAMASRSKSLLPDLGTDAISIGTEDTLEPNDGTEMASRSSTIRCLLSQAATYSGAPFHPRGP